MTIIQPLHPGAPPPDVLGVEGPRPAACAAQSRTQRQRSHKQLSAERHTERLTGLTLGSRTKSPGFYFIKEKSLKGNDWETGQQTNLGISPYFTTLAT